MQLELLNKILVFVINASAIIMGAVVYFKNRKGVLNQVFILTLFLMLAWVDFAYAPRVIGHAYPHEALLLLKIAWFITPLFFASLYFLADLLVNGVEFRVMGVFVAMAAVIDALLVADGSYVVSGIRFQDVPVSIDYGRGIFIYLGIVTLIIFATIYVIYKQYYYSTKDNRRKLQYFIIGLTIFYIQNIIFNISLPIFFHVSQWYWLGDYSTLVVLVFIAIAIVRHQLFEVKVVLTALVVLVASMLLLLDVVLFSNGSTLFVKAFILLLFIVLGVYLVKIEIREIRRREEIQALSTQLAAANKQLKSLDALKTEFLSIATHQLRTPLTGIKGYISMIADGDFGEVKPEQKKVLDDVLDNTEKLVQDRKSTRLNSSH